MWWRRREFFEELDRMRREINRMFEDLFGRTRRAVEHVSPVLEKPLVDIYETDDEVVVVADLPGLEKDDISINAMEDTLEISAETKKAGEAKKPRYFRQERRYKRFYRRLRLPAKVNPEKVKSTYRNGVLEVRLPKIKVKKGVRIKIE